MTTATIRIFLVHGDPKRLRTAEISNWTGKAVSCPRTEFDGMLAREESDKSGIYLLTGTDPESGKPAVYIGEAECIKDRIKGHVDKDFWNLATYFVSKDENLTKAHIRYLEGKLIELARGANRALVTNGQSSGAKLPESDRGEMEVFLEKINQLLPVLGVDLFVPVSAGTPENQQKKVLFCEIKGFKATGYRIADGFLVLENSEAVLIERPSSEKWPWSRNMRQRLRDDGILVEKGDRLIFTKEAEFSSPSSAAAVIHGGHANGLTAWKDAQGKTLKELEAV
ncbi:MAG: GIY-YIG nuclease family protein [Elusimicrobiota bacterium]